MKKCPVKAWIVLIVSNWLKVAIGDNAFIDDPPDDYYKRTSLDDCPNRFYSDDVSSALNFFILGGSRAYRSEFPHMAAVGWTNPATGKVAYECGGSLISTRYVVTAAHCGFDDKGILPGTIRLGDTDLGTTDDDVFAQDLKIRKFIQHPNYKRTQKYYDIALIELEQEARLNAAVCPICLWAKDGLQQFSGGLQVAGYGVTDYAGDHSSTLQKATLDYYDFDSCNKQLPRPRSLFKGITSDQFCAKTPMKDTCQGDSGGPIQVELSDINKAIPFLVGVTSFGTGCWDGSFGIYTKISSYVDWIRSIVNVTVDPMACARQSECLSSRKFSDSRITPQNNSPFFRVELARSGKSFNQCSGALIDYRHVVTSASCTSWNNLQPTQVLANEQSIDITEITRHPLFVPGRHYNDIAVLRLDKFYNPHKIYQIVAPACIWNKGKIPEPIVFYSGYGPDSSGSSSSQETYVSLKILTAFFLDNGRCNSNYSSQFAQQLPGGFNGDFVCAENPVDLVPGICKLEPGGPISNFRRDNVVPYVYGVNTLGAECGGAGNLFVATRISSYYNWIESIVLNRTEKVVDSRFESDDHENDIHSHPVVNRGDFPSESHFVTHILPGLIATDHRLKPYGSQFTPLATASIYPNQYGEIDGSHAKLTIYGAQLDKLPSASDEIFQTLRSIPVHHNFPSSNSIEIIKSIEHPVREPIREFTIRQQPNHYPFLQTQFSTPESTFRFRSTIPQTYLPPTTNSIHYQRTPAVSRRLVANPFVSAPRATSSVASESFSIVKSVELYQDGHCTLSSGRSGRCVHYSACSVRASSYCNTYLLTVCCPL